MKGKRKYTKEQLEFYFKRLMNRLGRVPTIDDIDADRQSPSSHAYAERFGSWENAKKLFGNMSLNRTNCTHCGKEMPFKKLTKRFCNRNCYNKYRQTRALESLPLRKCWICKKEFSPKRMKDRKRKVCYTVSCVERDGLIRDIKRSRAKKITPGLFSRIASHLGGKCIACNFNLLLRIYPASGRENDTAILNKIKSNNFALALLCPNHYEMLKKGYAHLEEENGSVFYRFDAEGRKG